MPDWSALVRNRLRNLDLSPEQKNEIIAELSGHLEDVHEEGITHGLREYEAMRRSLEQMADSHHLSRKIQRLKGTEGTMNYRTKTFWLPALISLAAAMTSLMISTQLAVQPRFLARSFVILHTSTTSTSVNLMAYFQWWIVLPFCGAAGAYFSRRAGGRTSVRLMAGLFPWVSLFTLVAFLTSIGQIVPFRHQWTDFIEAVSAVSVPPAIALLLGVIPFLRDSTPQELA